MSKVTLGPNSRERLAIRVRDEQAGEVYMLVRSRRILYDPGAANRIYKGQAGDNLFSIAARHFRGYPRPSSLFWLLGDYQPTPILDASKDLEGTEVFIPPAEKVAAILRTDESSG